MECQIARALIIPDNFLTVELNTVQVIEWTDSHLVIEEKTNCVVNTFDLKEGLQNPRANLLAEG
jgi:hypothetical protein